VQTIVVQPDRIDGIAPRKTPQQTPVKTVYRRAIRKQTHKAYRRYERTLRGDRMIDRVMAALPVMGLASTAVLVTMGVCWLIGRF